jgi:hypothetical protein
MGYFIPVARIWKWVEAEHLSFLFDARVAPKACFEQREKLREKVLFSLRESALESQEKKGK